MKFKKIISAISAFAMAASLFTVASAASLGGKPTVTATFDKYEKISDSAAFAYVNVTMDASAAEALEVYSSEFDFATMANVTKGNGITTMGISVTAPAGFTYVPSYSTIPSTVGVKQNTTEGTITITVGPHSNAPDYVVDEIITVKLAFAVTSLDASAKMDVTNASLDGKNSAENSTWSYHIKQNTIDVTGCSIPSYNEWSKPADPEPTVVPATAVTSATTGDDEVLDTTSKAAQAYVAEAAIASGDKVTWVAANRTSEIDATIANIDATTKLGLIITGDASTLGAISLKVAAN